MTPTMRASIYSAVGDMTQRQADPSRGNSLALGGAQRPPSFGVRTGVLQVTTLGEAVIRPLGFEPLPDECGLR